jgi:uncharacterized protein (TIGR03437 family)
MSVDLPIADLSGQATDFRLLTSMPGLHLSTAAGTTPAVVRVSIDPSAFTASTVGSITIEPPDSVRLAEPVRIVVNVREPDYRGTPLSIPGRLVDLLADPRRDRFYVLRQDRNQALVYDGTTLTPLAALKTGQTPTQMATTFDGRFLLVGNDNSRIANVIDLESLQPSDPIVFPGGHYPRSLASSGRTILAAARVAGPGHKIDRVDFTTRSAVMLPVLGVWRKDIHLNTVLVGSGNGNSILAAQANGTVYLYSAAADTFVVSRRDQETLTGAYAASNLDQFVIGNSLLNASLVTVRRLSGSVSAGFAFRNGAGVRLSPPGVLERVDLASGLSARPTRTAEGPAAASPESVFTRTLALLSNQRFVAALGTSGVTILPVNYDEGTVPPQIDRVLSSADGGSALAPGSLVSLYGTGLSPSRIAAREIPLPTSLGESCLSVNGIAIPMVFVSPEQINAQLPFTIDGAASLVLRNPAGLSNTMRLRLEPTAPGVFLLPVPGLGQPGPAIFNLRNGGLVTGSNPAKRGDGISIFLAGLGRTSPAVAAGAAAPLAETALPATASLGGVETAVEFSGLVPGSVGVYVIQARIPRNAPTGLEIPLQIQQGAAAVSLNVRVID